MPLASSQAQTHHNTYGDWNVYTVAQGGKTVCYITSAPTKKSGNYSSRGEPYTMITHRSANVDEVSVSSGYTYKDKSDVKTTIDGTQFNMFSKDELAWAYDEKQDSAMVSAMKKGSKMAVKGTSRKGTYSEDSYSLKGISKAYDKMKELCK